MPQTSPAGEREVATFRPAPPPAPAFVYSQHYSRFDYGPSHPLRISRLALTVELIRLCGLEVPWHQARAASFEELREFHDLNYLETLRELSAVKNAVDYGVFGFGAGDNPVFPGVYDWSALLAGATLMATSLVVDQGYPSAFNIAGGMHHALPSRASGFCYVNDAALAISRLRKLGKKVAYIDLDAHHGDGVQWAFYQSDQVLTISLHQHPATLFPGTGYREETGEGRGKGYSVNLPLWPDSDDDIYIKAFDEVVPPLIEAFAPDYIVTQLGVDTFLSDPLANLNLTTRAFRHCLERIKRMAWGGWIALGGGGYDVLNVARGWTLAWALMQGRLHHLPAKIPPEMVDRLGLRSDDNWLLSPDQNVRGPYWHRARREAEDNLAWIKGHVFPLLKAQAP